MGLLWTCVYIISQLEKFAGFLQEFIVLCSLCYLQYFKFEGGGTSTNTEFLFALCTSQGPKFHQYSDSGETETNLLGGKTWKARILGIYSTFLFPSDERRCKLGFPPKHKLYQFCGEADIVEINFNGYLNPFQCSWTWLWICLGTTTFYLFLKFS